MEKPLILWYITLQFRNKKEDLHEMGCGKVL